MAAKAPLKRQIVLIEGISPVDRGGQEKPILGEFFKMLNWRSDLRDAVDQGSASKNKQAFLGALLETQSRFIHVSAHGSGDDLTIDQRRKHEATIKLDDIKDYCRKRSPPGPLRGRFITISACGDIAPSFALGLHEHAGAAAVITPLASLDFGESALFAMMFYFTLLAPHGRKKRHAHAERMAQYIDSFSRTKTAYLSVGGTGAHRLDYWWRGEQLTIG